MRKFAKILFFIVLAFLMLVAYSNYEEKQLFKDHGECAMESMKINKDEKFQFMVNCMESKGRSFRNISGSTLCFDVDIAACWK